MGWHAFKYYPPVHAYVRVSDLDIRGSYCIILARTSDCRHFERGSSGK
jgi:hypothetical protein